MRSIRYSSMPVLLMLAFILAIVGCKKPESFFNTDTGDQNRKEIVKFKDGGGDIIVYALDAVPTIETILLMEVIRDPNSQTDGDQPLTVKLIKDAALIADYNTANGTDFVELPTNAYTLSADPTTITFGPGETSKQFSITLDKSKLDLSNQYAIAYSFTDIGSPAVASTTFKYGLFGIIIKNKYDGHYSVTGTLVDYANADITGLYPLEWDLVTTGANSVLVVDRDYTGTPTHIIGIVSTGGVSQYGTFGLNVTFDPVTDKIVSVTNSYGQPAGNTRSAQLDPTGLNLWNPANKSIDIKYFMLQPSVVTIPPYIRTAFAEHWEYVGPR